MSRSVGSGDSVFLQTSTFPLCDPGGGNRPVANVPGVLRPYAAMLGVRPIEMGKHDTTGTRFTKTETTTYIVDGKEETDSVQTVETDT
ncbi:MAG: hypothetical protein ACRDRH_24850 [Pseudonocardia sp.]